MVWSAFNIPHKEASRAILPSETPLCAQFNLTSSSISAVCFSSLIAMLFVSRLNCFYWFCTVLSNDFSCKPHLIWFMGFLLLPQIQLQNAYSTSKSIILNITWKGLLSKFLHCTLEMYSASSSSCHFLFNIFISWCAHTPLWNTNTLLINVFWG